MWITLLCISSVILLLNAQCISNGNKYHAGENFLADDGCNTCICTASGVAACTLMLCINEKTTTTPEPTTTTQPPVPHGSGVCKENGATHNAGDHYLAADGCNTCICSENGLSLCTLMFCLPEKNSTPPIMPRADDFKEHQYMGKQTTITTPT